MHDQKRFLDRRSAIREIVFGTQDGLLVPLGVTAGVAGATAQAGLILVAGLAEALAGTIAMGMGAYLASRAEQDLHQAAISLELATIRRDPDHQRAELAGIFEAEGLSQLAAATMVEQLVSSPPAFARTLIEKKLGLALDHPETPVRDSLIVGASYLIGAAFPIVPYTVLNVSIAFPASLLLTLCALFGLGVLKGRMTRARVVTSALEVTAAGVLSGIAGYELGALFPHWINLQGS